MGQNRGTHDELMILKEVIQNDPHLLDQVLDRIRQLRKTSGQSMTDYMKENRMAESDILNLRRKQQQKD